MDMRFAPLALAASISFGPVASAAIIVHTAPFITTPIASNDFESIGTFSYPEDTPYTQGGITVEYHTAPGVAPVGISTGNGPYFGNGSYDWALIDNSGYTGITLADASSFNQIQFLTATGGAAGLEYELLLGGSIVDTGFLPLSGLTGLTRGFSGASFDEVRLQTCYGQTVFSTTCTNDRLRLDDILIGRTPTGGVPEPATWALLFMGFSLAGVGLRRRGGAPALR